MLPGWATDHALARIREAMGEDGFEVAFDETVVGNRSPADTPLMDSIAAFVEREDPGAKAVPVVLPGFSDSRWLRAAFPDCVAYGFFPQRAMDLFEAAPLMHGADERMPVEDLGHGRALLLWADGGHAGDEHRATDKLRLGGMALRNGLLVHGPTHWAAAVRDTRRRGQGGVGAQARPGRQGQREDPRRARRGQAGRGDGGDPAGQARRCPRPGCRCRTCARWPRWPAPR